MQQTPPPKGMPPPSLTSRRERSAGGAPIRRRPFPWAARRMTAQTPGGHKGAYRWAPSYQPMPYGASLFFSFPPPGIPAAPNTSSLDRPGPPPSLPTNLAHGGHHTTPHHHRRRLGPFPRAPPSRTGRVSRPPSTACGPSPPPPPLRNLARSPQPPAAALSPRLSLLVVWDRGLIEGVFGPLACTLRS